VFNLRSGFGKQAYGEGHPELSYEGEWSRDAKNGSGTMIWRSGEKYVGEWSNDLQHGSGVLYSPAGAILKQGQWEDGRFKEDA
jgi:hypothetical protein